MVSRYFIVCRHAIFMTAPRVLIFAGVTNGVFLLVDPWFYAILPPMQILSHYQDIHAVRDGRTLGLVPTMGALHAGHLALVARARAENEAVYVSIFVNPLQFGANEDLDAYPRQLERDMALLQDAGADIVYTPSADLMYPEGFTTNIHVAGLSDTLCGAARPGHFDGVATVVAKLIGQTQPKRAYFGEKDYQQLCMIRRMVRDLNLPTEIVAVPTLREADGLAMSSRNAYLSDAQRAIAPALYETLLACADGLALPLAKARLLEKGFESVDYLALCQANTLMPLEAPEPRARLLAAAWLGKARLIDNIEVVS